MKSHNNEDKFKLGEVISWMGHLHQLTSAPPDVSIVDMWAIRQMVNQKLASFHMRNKYYPTVDGGGQPHDPEDTE